MKILFAIVFGLIPVIFCPYLIEQFEFPKIALLGMITVGCLPLLFQRRFKLDAIGMAFLLFLTSSVLSTILSISPRFSMLGSEVSPNGLIVTCIYVTAYFVIKELFSTPREGRTLLKAALFGGTVACIYAICQFCHIDFIIWNNSLLSRGVLRPAGTLGHPNFLSAFLVMLIPITLFFALMNRTYYVLTGLFLVVIVLAQSRGSWIALIACLAIWMAFQSKKPLIQCGKIALFGLLPFVCKWIYGHLTPPISKSLVYSLIERMALLYDTGLARNEYAAAGLRIFKQFPWFGSGTDTFQLAFEHQRTPFYWLHEWAGAPHRAHNELINIIATQGILGLVALTVLVVAILMASWKALSANFEIHHCNVPFCRRMTHSKQYTAMLFAIVAAFFVQNLASFTVCSTGILFIATLALLTNVNNNYNDDPPFEYRFSYLIPIFMVIFAYPVFLKANSQIHTKTAIAYAGVNPIVSLAEADAAVKLTPNAEITQLIAFQLALAAFQHTQKAEYYQYAIARIAKAVELNPKQASNYYLFGLTLMGISSTETVENALYTAIMLEPSNPIFLAGTLKAEIQLKRFEQAKNIARMALEKYPRYRILHFYLAQAIEATDGILQAQKDYALAYKGADFLTRPTRQEAEMTPERIEQAARALRYVPDKLPRKHHALRHNP